jgi:dethiobiotin synthetase
MTARLVVVSGTGTGIGKTHFSEALLKAAGRLGLRALGLKPIETGLAEATASDADRLDHASTFHVQLPGYFFAEPISPHLAAREAGQSIEIAAVVESVRAALEEADLVVVELPGGLFTPLADDLVNADLAVALAPDRLIVVATDRLGVLHDVLATTRAAAAIPLSIDAVVLMPPFEGDASTGRNLLELLRLLPGPSFVSLRRASPDDLAADPALADLARDVVNAG